LPFFVALLLTFSLENFLKLGWHYYTSAVYVYKMSTHLFVKVPRPGDSEGTFSVFESSCHLLLTTQM